MASGEGESVDWCGVWGGVSPPLLTRGSGSVVSSPAGSGAEAWPKTDFDAF